MISDMEKIHLVYIEMLNTLEEICKKNNIHYHISGGTLLGAIREKGFIPWDDDCDINILRKDYEKFKAVSKEILKSKNMLLIDPHDEDIPFQDFVTRIFYIDYVYREDDEYKTLYNGLYQYLWIDVFIYDNINEKKKNSIFFLQKMIYGLSMGHRKIDNFNRNKSKVLNGIAYILSRIGKLFPLTLLKRMHYKLSLKYENKNSLYVYCSNYPPIWMKSIILKSKLEDLIYVDFLNIKLPVIKAYDEYLKYWYGDYMSKPPIEKQIPEHKNNIF